MQVPVEVQVWRLAVLFLAGVGADLLFHAYRAFRSVFRPGKVGYHLLDVIVALTTMTAVGCVVYAVNRGEVRFYILAAMACGFWVSNILVGDLAYQGSRSAFRYVRKSLIWIRMRLIEPPVVLLRQAWHGIKTNLGPPPPEAPPDPPPE